jgi:hypothetical protein
LSFISERYSSFVIPAFLPTAECADTQPAQLFVIETVIRIFSRNTGSIFLNTVIKDGPLKIAINRFIKSEKEVKAAR